MGLYRWILEWSKSGVGTEAIWSALLSQTYATAQFLSKRSLIA
ncbi:MAG TPA: hypothetical protein VKX31_09060 [Brumimicrobium sp.]|nr:hypothetical protein [Brumimicrobium sp.]